MRRAGGSLALIAVMATASCGGETGPASPNPPSVTRASTPAETTTPSAAATTPPLLPESTYAEACVKDNRRLTEEFLDFLETFDPATATVETARTAMRTFRRIAYSLALNAGGMEVELREEGPVARGDECLFGAALGLKIIASAFPDGSGAQLSTEDRARRHYRSLLEFYPDSPWAEDARDGLADLG